MNVIYKIILVINIKYLDQNIIKKLIFFKIMFLVHFHFWYNFGSTNFRENSV